MKKLFIASLLSLSAGISMASTPTKVQMLFSEATVRISDDGKNTYLNIDDSKGNRGLMVFVVNVRGESELVNYVIERDGRLRLNGVPRHFKLVYEGEHVKIDRT